MRKKILGGVLAVSVSGYALSQRSIEIIKPLDPEFKRVILCAGTKARFEAYHGLRSDNEQQSMIAKGVSWVKRSKHQDGLAVDVMALDEKGKGTWDIKYYPAIAEAFNQCSLRYKVPITWGCEWKVRDCVHFEKRVKK